MKGRRRFCTFYLGGRQFGFEVDRVQEVINFQPITRVPHAPPVIAGLISLRGLILLTLDLRIRLAIASEHPDRRPKILILRGDEGALGLLVDEIGPVLDVAEECFERIPETVGAEARDMILGAYKLEGGLLLALDPERSTDVQVLERKPN